MSSDGATVKSGSTRAASEFDGVACKHPRHKLLLSHEQIQSLIVLLRPYVSFQKGPDVNRHLV